MKPTKSEIEEVLGQCVDILGTGGSNFPALSYEEGVAAALEWVIDAGNNPLSE